jgi:long-chain acyl-CoA synthetase
VLSHSQIHTVSPDRLTHKWVRFYDAGVPATLDSEPLPLPAVLERTATDLADNTAIIFMNRRMDYRELKGEVDGFATALTGLGVGAGSVVGIQLPNLPQTIIAYYAALSVGARVVMTNPLYVEREIEHQWNDAGCEAVVVADYLFEQRINAIRDRLPVKNYIVTSIADYLKFPFKQVTSIRLRGSKMPKAATIEPDNGVYLMRRLIREAHAEPTKTDIDVDDVAVLQYTGGTTGQPKAAMLTHRNLSSNVLQVRAWFTQVEPGRDVFLAALPFFHVFGMTIGMNFPIAVGAAMVVMPDPRAIRQMTANIAKHRVTIFPGVPALLNLITNLPGVEDVDMTSVKACICGSAPLPQDTRERFQALTGTLIAEGFGLTETSPVTHANPLSGLRKDRSIGVPVPGTEAKIVSLSDGASELAPGHAGELVIRGPQVMQAYWNRPAETAETIKDGWLYTGDIASMDEDGYFFIVGRKKEVIIAGGYNIYPDEIDDVLMAHPAVVESGTIGVPDQRRGETVKSFVVLAKGQDVTAKELIEHCRAQLAAYKVPRQIEFRDSLPKSGALKILRRKLREQELGRMKGWTSKS